MEEKRLRRVPCNPGVRDLIRGKRQGSIPLPEPNIRSGFLGWHENGYLPHRDEPGLTQFVTFRLADAFPAALRSEWGALLKIENDLQRRLELESYLDRGRGRCHLRHPDVAGLVESALLFRHDVQYELRAWVLMPNHVHVLLRVGEVPLWKVVSSWKSFTAKAANTLLGITGQFWQEDYWDTYMRNEEHEARSRRYTEDNPTRAKLVAAPRDWPWSSARFRDHYERLCLPDR